MTTCRSCHPYSLVETSLSREFRDELHENWIKSRDSITKQESERENCKKKRESVIVENSRSFIWNQIALCYARLFVFPFQSQRSQLDKLIALTHKLTFSSRLRVVNEIIPIFFFSIKTFYKATLSDIKYLIMNNFFCAKKSNIPILKVQWNGK